uniref:hypothetical protein RF1 n=1 Tax=Scleria parvula TaxID=388579 RepID=UPI001F147CC7|nr:hypothetical protein RF1 [Scleria parvula]YP_010291686.1 hypothetical protein RF1 [Scleria parvula]ULQ67676.1 hypothetical protein RF1 [Scleria parvula]ULQ67693.1 hypothetical protein RF1 [Scleria parvula]
MPILIFKSVFSKLAQSVVVVGLSYGFLTTLSIGPSYFFLMQTRVMEEESEKDIASTTGFVVGQLMMFVSVFYLPMHLALMQPYTIYILVGLYFFVHVVSSKNEDFLDYESGPTTKNLIRKCSILCFFMNTFILQIFNVCMIPSSTLSRLVDIYMFRCDNKILFLMSSFVAWFIGQILLTKWFGLVFLWIRQTYAYAYGSKQYKGFLLHWKFTLLDWTYISSKNQVFRIFSVTIFIFYLSRVQYLHSLEVGNAYQREKKEKRQEGKTTFKTKDTQKDTKLVIQDQLGIQEITYLGIEKILVTQLFDFRRFYRPLRYIRNNSLYENSVQGIPVQNNMGQYYFGTCVSDGIKRISMKYRPGFEDFLEWLPKRIAFVYSYLFQKQIKLRRLSQSSKSQEYLYQNWISKNEQKKYNLINELKSRIKVLEEKEGFFVLDMLEKRTRLCNDKNEQKCFSKHKDPLLNGPNRNTIDISEIERFRKWIITITKNEDLKETIEKSEKMEDSKEKEETKKELGSMPILMLDPITSIKFMSPINRLRMMERIARTSRTTLYTTIVTEKIVTEKSSDKTAKITEKVTKIPKFTRVLPDIFKDEYAEMQKNVPTWVRDLRDAVEILEENWAEEEEEEENWDEGKDAEEEEEEERPDEGKDVEEEEEEEGERDPYWMADIFLRRYKNIPIYTIDKHDIDEDGIDEDMLEEGMLEDEKKMKKGDMLEDQKKVLFNNDTNDTELEEQPEQVTLIHYLKVTDLDRDLIQGTIRPLRRKTVTWDLYQPCPRSPIFLDRTENGISSFLRRRFFSVFDLFLKLFERMNLILRNSAGRKLEWKISQEEEMDSEEEKKTREMEKKQEIKQNEEDRRELLGRVWDENQHIRGFLLLTQSFLRRKIVLPSLIIAKNLVRMILSQSSEWDEDFKECEKEIHVKCTYDGLELSETEFPQNWVYEGIQIKIVNPFCLKPWRSQNREEKPRKSCFLTVLGKETNLPFGSARRQPSFFRPIYKAIYKELQKKMRKVQKKFLPLFEVFKEKKGGIIQKGNKRKVYEPTKNGKDSKIVKNVLNEPTIGIGSINWTIESLIERKIQDYSDGTIRIRNEIEQITKENNKILFTCDDKRTESPKSIWKIFQRKSIRLIRKFHYFRKFFIEKTYVNILRWMINNLSRTRINSKLFFESIKKRIKKFIYKNKTNKEGRKETVNFFCTQKKNQDYDLSSLSQAYVFYKISQSALLNKYNLRSLLQYHETYPFIKDEIKDYCRGIFDCKSRHEKMTKSQLWKNWLRSHYQYNLSQNKWSQLNPQEWRNRMQQHYMFPNKDSMTLDSYQKEKDNVLDYVKQNPYGFDPLSNQKEKLQKQYRYDLLSNIYMNFGDKKKNLAFSQFGNIAISDHLEDTFFLWKKKYLDRKYLDCRILLTKNSNIDTCTNNNKLIKTWVHTLIAGYQNTQERIKNKNTQTEEDQKEDRKKNENKKKEFFDWKKMNQEYKKSVEREKIVRSKPWFFPELVLLLNEYKKKPWITPIQLLLFDLDLCQDKKNDKKKEPESKNEKKVQVDFGTYLRKELGEEEKKMEVRKVNDIEEFYFLLKKSFLHQFKLDNPHIREDIMSNIEGGYHLLKLWKEYLKKKKEGGPISRTRDPKKWISAIIRKQELDLQPMSIVRDSNPSESGRILLENKFLIFEEFRLCQKIDEKSILYQMLSIDTSLVNQNQHQSQDFLRPEDILSSRRCRELRILSSFNYPNVTDRKSFYINKYMNRFDFNKENITNSGNENDITNSGNENDITNSGQLLNVFNEEELNTDANEFVKYKSFLWPNYRLEDLLCMNRYWFDTNNGSRFSMLRIRMYPQSRIKK